MLTVEIINELRAGRPVLFGWNTTKTNKGYVGICRANFVLSEPNEDGRYVETTVVWESHNCKSRAQATSYAKHTKRQFTQAFEPILAAEQN